MIRAGIARLAERLETGGRGQVLAAATGSLALVCAVDYATGTEIAFSIFYLWPVSMAAWYGGRGLGLALAGAAACVWLAADLLGQHAYTSYWVAGWNSLVRLGFFVLVALLLAQARRDAARLRAAKLAAESASRAKNAFLAGVSHELRTPLNAIINYAALLSEESPPDSQTASDVARIDRASRHLLHLINNVLDFSKIEAGRLELLVEDVDVEDVLADTREMVAPLAQRNRNALEIIADPAVRVLHTDGGRLRQILINLVGNAAKFTTDGTIRVSVTGADAGMVRFDVADTGIGMTEAELDRVFDAFTQASVETHRRFGGSGLGLTISRLLSEALGGTITAASTPGQGSRFTVRIPAVIPSHHPEEAS